MQFWSSATSREFLGFVGQNAEKIQISSKSLRGIDIHENHIAIGTGEGLVRILDLGTGKIIQEY